MTTSFQFTLHPTYYKQGFFNVSVLYQSYFGNDGDVIEVICKGKRLPAYINRRCNKTYAPRILGRVELRDWFQQYFQQGDKVLVTVDSTKRIQLSKPPKGI